MADNRELVILQGFAVTLTNPEDQEVITQGYAGVPFFGEPYVEAHTTLRMQTPWGKAHVLTPGRRWRIVDPV